jgi:hypothetical protein
VNDEVVNSAGDFVRLRKERSQIDAVSTSYRRCRFLARAIEVAAAVTRSVYSLTANAVPDCGR